MTDGTEGFTKASDEARERGQERLRGPRAVSVRYDDGSDRIVIGLSTGIELGIAPRDVAGLAGAEPAELRDAEVQELGMGVHFPRRDVDLYVPALLDGILGSRSWMAARLGAAGGRARTGAKAAAARRNGRRGGRPRGTEAAE